VCSGPENHDVIATVNALAAGANGSKISLINLESTSRLSGWAACARLWLTTWLRVLSVGRDCLTGDLALERGASTQCLDLRCDAEATLVNSLCQSHASSLAENEVFST
jgi:hypothetical protein